MPVTTLPTISATSLFSSPQPSLRFASGELVLHPWNVKDVAALYNAYQDPDIYYWHVRRMNSLQEAEEWIKATHQSWQQENAAEWAITRSNDGKILGRMALRSVDLHEGLAECAYWVLPLARRAGIASQALATMADWALNTVGFHRLELEHSVENLASCRVATKADFTLESTRRSSALHIDGWHDMHLHTRIRESIQQSGTSLVE